MVAYAKNRVFSIIQSQEKCIIQQLISNFTTFWQKKNVLMRNGQSFKKYQRQKKVHNSIISHENREFCPIFIEIIAYVRKKQTNKQNKTAHLKIISPHKSLFSELLMESRELC